MKVAGFFGILLLAASSPTAKVVGDPLDLCDFRLVWSEEFDELSASAWALDGKRWMAHTPWRGDFGDARFANPGPNGPFAVKHGELRITASKDRKGRWHSGLLAAADASGVGAGVRYGYFEARMRMPPGPGTWPAFWLISLKPTADKTPKVEVDVVEYYGHADDKYQIAWHVWFEPPNEHMKRADGEMIDVPAGSLVDRFHNFGVQVDPEWMTYYLNRVPVARAPTPPELKTPLYPLVNLALGSGWPIDKTPNPSVLRVSHVRMYETDREGRASRCPDHRTMERVNGRKR